MAFRSFYRRRHSSRTDPIVIAFNYYLVTERDGKVYIQLHPDGMDREHALKLAAWLVICCKRLPGTLWLENVIKAINKR